MCSPMRRRIHALAYEEEDTCVVTCAHKGWGRDKDRGERERHTHRDTETERDRERDNDTQTDRQTLI